MTSFQELMEHNEQGYLSKMLADKFCGERSNIKYQNEDKDVIISFVSVEVTPFADVLEQAIIEYYTKLGCTLKKFGSTSKDVVELMVFVGDMRQGFMTMTITSHYPFFIGKDHGEKYLRLTTELLPLG